ncbi:MAG: hypothetical protein D6690_16600 [Nitrospirae bacterium]|nr:MAG: hypothetical protein D6690_16600 [Nitrospirota bacterium]
MDPRDQLLAGEMGSLHEYAGSQVPQPRRMQVDQPKFANDYGTPRHDQVPVRYDPREDLQSSTCYDHPKGNAETEQRI